MQEHWKTFGPPLYIAYAAIHKLTKKPRKKAKLKEKGAAADFMRDFAAAGGRVQ